MSDAGSPTGVAFAGSGWVTVVHGMAIEAFDDLRVAHVASRHREHAVRRARQTGAVAVGYDDLPAGDQLVIVATAPTAHRSEAERAVAGGAAALVETPLATTLADADALVDLAARGRVAYAENLVHSPVVAAAVDACRRVGDLTHLEVRFAQGRPEGGLDRTSAAWGGGVLFDLGVHALALALLMAAPARVTAVTAKLLRGEGMEVDDDATVTLAFETGLSAQVRSTWRAAAPMWDAQAASATSAVRIELVPEPTVELNGTPLRLPRPPSGLPTDQLHHLGYLDQVSALAADVAAGRTPRVGPAFGRVVLEILCAAYTSARTGEPEALPFTGPRHRTPVELWAAG